MRQNPIGPLVNGDQIVALEADPGYTCRWVVGRGTCGAMAQYIRHRRRGGTEDMLCLQHALACGHQHGWADGLREVRETESFKEDEL